MSNQKLQGRENPFQAHTLSMAEAGDDTFLYTV